MTDSPDFTPVRVAARTDGWTPDKQAAFIDALGQTACVATAARQVGMSRESAYRLRARPDAAGFRDAWEAALDYAYHRLGEAALDRALNGVPVPIFYRGEQVGERRHYDERLTQFLLRTRDPLRHTPLREQAGIRWTFTLEDFARRLHSAAAMLLARKPKPAPRKARSNGEITSDGV
jgi:hypothetical protein